MHSSQEWVHRECTLFTLEEPVGVNNAKRTCFYHDRTENTAEDPAGDTLIAQRSVISQEPV